MQNVEDKFSRVQFHCQLWFSLIPSERPRITVLFQLFLCSITVTAKQVLYVLGLQYLTATIACALNNLLPAVTLVLAVFWRCSEYVPKTFQNIYSLYFYTSTSTTRSRPMDLYLFSGFIRLENVQIRTAAGQAKVIGTIVCVGGSTLLSFYHGHIIDTAESKYTVKMNETSSNKGENFLGAFLIMLSCAAWAVGIIIQAQLGKNFEAPCTTTAVMSFMASIECTAIAFISEHKISAWSLRPSIRLIASLHGGIVCNALAFCLITWSIEKKGPLYVSMFSPLSLVIGAILSFALLHEKLFIGTLAGSVLIVAGLYAVLWGKDRETKQMKPMGNEMETKQDDQEGDLEVQVGKINDHPTKIGENLDPVLS